MNGHSMSKNIDEASPRLRLKSHKESYNYGKTKGTY
jgi:hypothetical protein